MSSLPHFIFGDGFDLTAIYNLQEYWGGRPVNRHFLVISDDIRNPKLQGQFDLITCVGVLELIKASDRAMTGMLRLLKPGGSLLLTVPYSESQ